MKRPLNLLVPAAGKGSRFSENGYTSPKPLIGVWDIPMLIWVLSNFPLEAEDKITVLTQSEHNIPGKLSSYLKKFEQKVTFLEIDFWTDGPAHSLELLLEHLPQDEPVICANSDQYIFSGLPAFVSEVRKGESSGQILTMHASGNAWSYVGRNNLGKVNQVVEKREISSEATVGVYGWDSVNTAKEALSWQRAMDFRVNGEFYVAPSYHYLIERNLPISTHSVGPHGEGVHGLGVPVDLEAFLKLNQAKQQSEHLRHRFLRD